MKKYGLIGRKLDYSFSKSYFTDYFKKNGIDATYENIEIDSISRLKDFATEYNGLNVTIPYKEEVMALLDEIDLVAEEIGAVNTIAIENNKIIGYNTDAFGFHQSIKPFLTNLHEKAIILGTGGASKAVAFVLENLGIDCLYISRHPKGENQFSYEDVNEYMVKYCKLIVNTTPIGTYPDVDETPAIPYQYLTEEHLLVDLVYNPEETRFMKLGRENGATAINGLTMLKEQALQAYKIWTEDNE